MATDTENDNPERTESLKEHLETSDTSLSTSERYRRLFSEFILVPSRIIWNDWRARVGTIIFLVYIAMGTIGVAIVEYPRSADDPSLRFLPPFQRIDHPLGTDVVGRDILGMIVHATPPMLQMMLAGAIFSIIMATVVGVTSGYKSGTADSILMLFTDIMLTLPGLPLIIVLAAILEPRSTIVVGIVLTINAWAGLARSIRSQVLTLKNESYVEASRVMGISTPIILTKDIIPGIMPYILINFVQTARQVIFASVALYFLGILPFTNFNWGVMLNMAYTGGGLYSWNLAHWLIAPMIVIVVLSFGLVLFAQGTDRLFNPRVRARHAKTIEDD